LPSEQFLLNQEPLWKVQTKLFEFVEWLQRDVSHLRQKDLSVQEHETFIGVLKKLAGDTELSGTLV
jgi:hypothetical protein